MLCTRCGSDAVPDWVVCPLCGAEADRVRHAQQVIALPARHPGRTADRIVSVILLSGAGVYTAGVATAPVLRDDWFAFLLASSPSSFLLPIAAGLLWFARTAAAGAGIAVGHLAVAFSPRPLSGLLEPPADVLILDSPLLQPSGWILLVVLAACLLTGFRAGRFTWRKDGRAWALLGVLPLVHLAGDWLPETATPVVGFGGRDYAACCFMFEDPSLAPMDWTTVEVAVAAVIVTTLAGLVVNPRLAGGLILGAVWVLTPPAVLVREEGTIPLPGFWIAVAAVATMAALALVLLTSKETGHRSSRALSGTR
ncbi:hypothetical protein [Microbispora amethystogenes]|uniref:Zinc ribbon domain-containing protein n=1 Tax=Microbispora amethystogenes TaxID=1427754 RepID=A0ABQ4FCR8_9ACTN|nr:hypothetical protein [Microbispora amethystogenes]GIH32622.1 hypothetical protein Mam01_27860 [Microbispora amethystogenes]